MKNKNGLVCVLIGVFTFSAFGWYASSDTTGEHYQLSTWLLTDTGFNYMPYFKSYAERLEESGFDINEIIEQADDEVYDGIGYIGAFFNGTDEMDLHLRNLETNENATYSNQTMYPMVGLSVTPDQVFLISANTLTDGQCFDGWIDEVRISNKYLTDDCILYNYLR